MLIHNHFQNIQNNLIKIKNEIQLIALKEFTNTSFTENTSNVHYTHNLQNSNTNEYFGNLIKNDKELNTTTPADSTNTTNITETDWVIDNMQNKINPYIEDINEEDVDNTDSSLENNKLQVTTDNDVGKTESAFELEYL